MTEDTVTKNFLGIPIKGHIQEADRRVPQRPIEEFAPILTAVLTDENIFDLGWRQYTPYFNDGDPCVFGAWGFWVRTVKDVPAEKEAAVEGLEYAYEEEEDDEGGYRYELGYSHPTFATEWKDVEGSRQRVLVGDWSEEWRATYDRCKALEAAVEGGAFDNVLLDAFGDHAEIRVTKTEIKVDEYSHD